MRIRVGAPKSPWRQRVACCGKVMSSRKKVTPRTGTEQLRQRQVHEYTDVNHPCLSSASKRSLTPPAVAFGKMAPPVRHTETLQHLPPSFFELFTLLPLFSYLYLWNLERQLLWEPASQSREPLGSSLAVPPHGLGVHFPAWAAPLPARDGHFHPFDFAGTACHLTMALS